MSEFVSILSEILDHFSKNIFSNSRLSQGMISPFPDGSKYSIDGKDATILDLLSDNSVSHSEYKRTHNNQEYKQPFSQAFETAWKEFGVIEKSTFGIIVPYKEGSNLIGRLDALEKYGENYFVDLKSILKDAQQFSVNVYSSKSKELLRDDLIREVIPESEIYVLNDGFYSDKFGLSMEFVGMTINLFWERKSPEYIKYLQGN